MVLKVATRGSKLALKQTDIAIAYLKKYLKDIDFEIVIVKTHGDKDQTSALYNMQTNGVFVKDVEEALVCHQADIAVHSLKDVSSTLHEGLMLLPHLIFENKQDCLITKNKQKLKDIKANGIIATSSIRRMACIHHLRPDISFVNMRGNIDTRINKFMNSDYDGMILAGAGLQRLGLDNYISEYLDPSLVIPACGQGTIALEIRKEDMQLYQALFDIYDIRQKEVDIERDFLKYSNASCHEPVGCYVKINDKINIYAMKGTNIDDSIFVHEVFDLDETDIALKMLRKFEL